jgi:hypothetical protein
MLICAGRPDSSAPRLQRDISDPGEEDIVMAKHHFKRGDHLSWNSEAGRVSGRITRVVTSEIEFKGYTVHASREEPQ